LFFGCRMNFAEILVCHHTVGFGNEHPIIVYRTMTIKPCSTNYLKYEEDLTRCKYITILCIFNIKFVIILFYKVKFNYIFIIMNIS